PASSEGGGQRDPAQRAVLLPPTLSCLWFARRVLLLPVNNSMPLYWQNSTSPAHRTRLVTPQMRGLQGAAREEQARLLPRPFLQPARLARECFSPRGIPRLLRREGLLQPALIGPPVHPRRFRRKGLHEVALAAEPLPNRAGFAQLPAGPVLALTRVD